MKNVVFTIFTLISFNALCENTNLPMTEDKYDAYNGIVTCDELVEKIFQRKWDLRGRPSLFKDGVVPKCSNDQFPKNGLSQNKRLIHLGTQSAINPLALFFNSP